MNKAIISIIINVLLFLTLMAMTGLGLLLQFVLTPPAGPEGAPSLTWLGLARHHWEVAYFSGILVVLALAVAHLILHWAWYVKLYAEAVPNSTVRNILASLGAVAAFLLLCLPLLGKPAVKEMGLTAAPAAAPPTLATPAPVAPPSEFAVPYMVPTYPKVGGGKTAAVAKPRPKKISQVRRPLYHRQAYRRPAFYGKGYKKKPGYFRPGPYRAHVLAARRQ
ncbi:MAG: DUF4405 domain-containing protein [Desulfobaccales bacterium]